MRNLVFIKLGGSLITDKQQRYHIRHATVRRLADEIARARAADPTLRLLVAHGSGSFGHVAARESGYRADAGHPSPMALAQVGAAASALNHLVRAALLEAGVPVLSLPASASAWMEGGRLARMAVEPFAALLESGNVPLTYGDVVLRAGGGSAIASTEMIFRYLAERLQPERLLLLGIVEGVLQRPPSPGEPAPPRIPEITPERWEEVRASLGGSHGTDVTGGMASKVEETLQLVGAVPGLEARIVSGEQPGLLADLLLDPSLDAGTRLRQP